MSKTLKIEITAVDKGDNSAVGIYTERQTISGTWNRLDGVDAVTNKGPVTIEVEKGDRVMIDPFPNAPELAFDNDQRAAINPAAQKNPEAKKADAPSQAEFEKGERERKAKEDKERLERTREAQPGVGTMLPGAKKPVADSDGRISPPGGSSMPQDSNPGLVSSRDNR